MMLLMGLVGCVSTPPGTGTSNPETETTKLTEPVLGSCDRTLSVALTGLCTKGVSAVVAGVAFASVDAAVAGAKDGSTVWVCPGDHKVELELVDRTLTLIGGDPSEGGTILRGGGTHRVMSMTGSTVQLDGLTLTEGYAWNDKGKFVPDSYGGAIYARDSDLELSCSHIVDNTSHSGAALWATGSRLEVRASRFASNSHSKTYAAGIGFMDDLFPLDGGTTGQEVHLEPDIALVLEEVSFEDHSGEAALWASARSTRFVTVHDSTFTDNGVGAVFYGELLVSVDGSTFEGNDVGLHVDVVEASLMNVDVVDNTAGGISVHFQPQGKRSLSIEGGALRGNTAERGAALSVRRVWYDEASVPALVSLSGVEISSNAATDKDGAAIEFLQLDGDEGEVELVMEDCDGGSGKHDNTPMDLIWDGTIIDDVLVTDVLSLP